MNEHVNLYFKNFHNVYTNVLHIFITFKWQLKHKHAEWDVNIKIC